MKITFLNKLRKNTWFKTFSLTMAVIFLYQTIFPTVAIALTGGPSQPEFTSFEPASTSDMVDLYTGDFNYNIPLLSIPGPNGGYPINLAYHSGVGMEQEASWVGLGWSLNVGAINRQLRGLPDDFNGDEVEYKMDFKPSWVASVDLDFASGSAGAHYKETLGIPQSEALGSAGFPLSGQVYYNNYKGIGYRLSANLPSSMLSFSKGVLGMGVSYDSQAGIGLSPKFNVAGFNLGASISARQGLQGAELSYNHFKPHEKFRGGTTTNISLLSFPVTGFPNVSMPTQSQSTNFHARYGPVASSANVSWQGWFPLLWSGSYSINKVLDKEFSRPAYGYLNIENATDEGVKDFVREQFQYSKKIPNLPSSQLTYDILSITGQGLSGVARPHRNEVGVVSSDLNESETKGRSRGAEFAITGSDYIHIGFDFSNRNGTERSGPWLVDGSIISNPIGSLLSYTGATNEQIKTTTNDPFYEPTYYQMYGEKNAILYEDDHLNRWGRDEAVRMELDKSNNSYVDKEFISTQKFVTSKNEDSSPVINGIDDNIHFTGSRQRRATNIEYLDGNQSIIYGEGANLQYLDYTAGGAVPKLRSKSEDARDNPSHHISEISVLQPDGMRYTYALPVYNNSHKEALFSVDNSSANFNTSTVTVNDDGNGEIDLDGTYDEFLSETTMPPYVHSWLLTSVVSDDYVDLTNNGPTDDDYGYWVKFNYLKSSNDYKWRVPYEGANFVEGNKHDPRDNRGSFTEGEKEIYYIASIETKTHIAEFNLALREDAYEADDALNGGIESSPSGFDGYSYKLTSIELFVKNDETNTPLQKVELNYDYSLCEDIPNRITTGEDGDGKLTLTSLEFHYQNSTKGRLSPYKFTYASGSSNPGYEPRDIDRWGNYKPNSDNYPSTNYYPYVDFPYTDQTTPPIADAWSLTKIELPTGGEINIEYESDDYAYVEDQPAMQMFDIRGLDSWQDNSGRNLSSPVYGDLTDDVNDSEFRIYFKLNEPIDNSIYNNPTKRSNYVRDNLVRGMESLYFKVYANLKSAVSNENKDYVSGYAKIKGEETDDYGIEDDGGNTVYDRAYITVEGVPINETFDFIRNKVVGAPGGKIHPFRKAAIQHLRANRSELVSSPAPYLTDPTSQIENFAGSIPLFFQELGGMALGFNLYSVTVGRAKKIELNGKSIIRLYDDDGFKYGGGARVKRLSMNDNWENPNSTANTSEYGQSYDYTIIENGKKISSGVAYEPMVGDEESSLTQPIAYKQSTPLSSVYKLFQEKPLMRKYYPGASVGYRKVTVRSIAPEQAEDESSNSNHLKNSRAPLTVHEFYTPKDFPVLFDKTDLTKHEPIFRLIPIPGIGTTFRKKVARAQGYSVVLNDMAGKPYRVTQYTASELTPEDYTDDPNGNIVSRQVYIYNTKKPFNPKYKNELSSAIQVIGENGKYQTAYVGQTHDIFIDMHEDRSESQTSDWSLDLNLEILAAASYIPIPIPLPQISDNVTSIKTSVTHKVIYRTGILKEVINQNFKSIVKTENLAFDKESGQPILTKVTNEFEDDVFNYSYPAHWYYPGMGRASKNWGTVFQHETYTMSQAGRISITWVPTSTSVSDYFSEGDKIRITRASNQQKEYCSIVKVSDDPKFIDCVEEDGTLLATGDISEIRVIRSGYKNLLTDQAGGLVAMGQTGFEKLVPTNSSTYFSASANKTYSFNSIVDASAVEFSDTWQTECCNEETYIGIDNTVSPYDAGLKGIWRPYKAYSYLGDRDYSNDDIRVDGVYTSFTEFDWSSPGDPWFADNTITKYSPRGFELETQDAIGRYSAALYGYDQTLAEAIGANMQYKEMAFESFEDYDLTGNLSCQEKDHWGFYSLGPDIEKIAHTGKYGVRVGPGSTLQLDKSLNIKDCSSFTHTYGEDPTTFVVDSCDCIGTFSPIEGKEYVLSAWVHINDGFFQPVFSFDEAKISVVLLDGSETLLTSKLLTVGADEPVIDNWQRIFGTFTIPSGTRKVRVILVNEYAGNFAVFDDIRIHPVDGNMKTYVYDNATLRLSAELDENNYATFYNYDEEGRLVKIKKETARGIKTLEERKIGLPVNPVE